jgi:hypothetical protein
MSVHLKASQPLERDEFDPVWWTWCGELVEAEEVRDDPGAVDCSECLDLYEDDPPK